MMIIGAKTAVVKGLKVGICSGAGSKGFAKEFTRLVGRCEGRGWADASRWLSGLV